MTAPAPQAGGGNWADLRVRVISGIVVAALGLLLLISDGQALETGVSILTALLMWEMARLTGHLDQPERNARHALSTALMSGATMLVSLMLDGSWPFLLVVLPLVIGWQGTAPAQRLPFLLFTLAIFGAGYGLALTRESEGMLITFWIAGTVVVSDIMGYFVGRMLGGPKFWPAISPKKTWSGTIAGWVGAVVFALIVVLVSGRGGWALVAAGPVVALAGQFGDIAESWLKRRVGVKDSSNLIPGHGGVMDRFDAQAGAFLAALLLHLLGV